MSIYQNSKIYFYNNFHNGDVFYSKEFARDIKNKIGSEHYYIHGNDFSILKDFEIPQIRLNTPHQNLSISKKDNELYINTWIGQNGAKYLVYNCSLKSNYLLFSDIYKTLGIEIEPIGFYVPKVDFTKINKENIDNFFISKTKTVLFCNNLVNSGQAENIDFTPIIENIADKFKDITFIVTNNINIFKDNVIMVKDLIGYDINNLLEISYISTKSDIIIGRGSGPFCFSHIQDNMKDVNKTFIVFTHKEDEGKWVPDTESVAMQYWYNTFNTNDITNYIESIIKNKFYING